MSHRPGMDADAIRTGVQDKYREVSLRAEGHFPYPVGQQSATKLGYSREWLPQIPAEVIDRFVGVGNPLGLRRPRTGDRVLDVGCGCGLDTFVASLLVGAGGRAVGIDLTREMVDIARGANRSWPHENVEFHVGSVETLPFDDASFDLVTSSASLKT